MRGIYCQVTLLLLLSAGPLRAQELLNRAIQEFRAGDYESARQQLRQLISTSPRNAPAHSLLGLTFMAERQFADAEHQFRLVIKLQPNSPAAYVNLGNALVEEQRDQDALLQYMHAEGIRPDDPNALRAVGMIYARANNNIDAERFLSQAHRLKSTDLQTSTALAAIYIEQKKFREADLLLRSVNQRISSETAGSLALLALESGSPELSSKLVSDRPQLRSQLVDSAFREAIALAQTKDFQAALDMLKVVSEEPSRRAEYHDLLGTIYYELDQPKEAVDELQEAIRLDPQNEEHYFKLGMMFLKHRTAEGAIQVFTAALRVQPKSPKLLTGLGLSYYIQENREVAKENLEQAIALDPHYGPAYIVLCDLLSQANEDQDLIAMVNRAMRVEPNNYLLPYYYGKVLVKRGDPAADAELKKSIALNQQFAYAYFELGKSLTDQKNVSAAIGAFENCVRIDPQLAEAHYSLFRLYHTVGDQNASAEHFKSFQEIRKEYGDGERVRQLIFTVEK